MCKNSQIKEPPFGAVFVWRWYCEYFSFAIGNRHYSNNSYVDISSACFRSQKDTAALWL